MLMTEKDVFFHEMSQLRDGMGYSCNIIQLFI